MLVINAKKLVVILRQYLRVAALSMRMNHAYEFAPSQKTSRKHSA